MSKYYEDLYVGQQFISPRAVEMDRDSIVAFAQDWDPQLYHIDERAAANSPVGQIFASAIHSLATAQRLAHEAGVFDVLPVVGLGISDMQFPRPVVAGDQVRVRVTVSEMRPSSSRPGQGLVRLLIELCNQKEESVLSYALTELVRMRPSPSQA